MSDGSTVTKLGFSQSIVILVVCVVFSEESIEPEEVPLAVVASVDDVDVSHCVQ